MGASKAARFVVVLGSVSALLAGSGEMAGAWPHDDLPVDAETAEVYLLSHAAGDDLVTRWGHVALRVRDRRTGTDLVFDWGVAEARDPVTLVVHFLRGTPTYRLGIQAFDAMVRDYAAAGRTIRQERLRLSVRERARLLRRLAWNARAEHRVYPYDPFTRNCATHIRDHLDAALGGRLAERLGPVRAAHTRRHLVRAALRGRPLVALAVDLLLHAGADAAMSEWDELFLPDRLRAQLGAVPASTETEAPGAPLLAEPRQILALAPRAARRPGRQVGAWGLAPLGAAGVVLAHRAGRAQRSPRTSSSPTGPASATS